MSILNEDYSEIKRQLDYADSYFVQCQRKEDFYNCYATYKTFCDLYMWKTGENLFDLSGVLKIISKFFTEQRREHMTDQLYMDFYQNHDTLLELFLAPFLQGKIAYDEFLTVQGDYKNARSFRKLSSDLEGLQIICSFLDSEIPIARSVFDELIASERLYNMPDDSMHMLGWMFYNPLENKNNILLQNDFQYISDLAVFVHEFGHAMDFEWLSVTHPELCSPIISCDDEVMSSYYEFQFLEYLIRNNIYKEDAKKVLSNKIGSSLCNLENGFLLGLADSDEYQSLRAGTITKKSYIDSLLSRGVELPYSFIIDDSNNFISTEKTLIYSYGFILGCAISDKSIYHHFLENRGLGIKEMLDRSHITKETVVKQLNKKIDILY